MSESCNIEDTLDNLPEDVKYNIMQYLITGIEHAYNRYNIDFLKTAMDCKTQGQQQNISFQNHLTSLLNNQSLTKIIIELEKQKFNFEKFQEIYPCIKNENSNYIIFSKISFPHVGILITKNATTTNATTKNATNTNSTTNTNYDLSIEGFISFKAITIDNIACILDRYLRRLHTFFNVRFDRIITYYNNDAYLEFFKSDLDTFNKYMRKESDKSSNTQIPSNRRVFDYTTDKYKNYTVNLGTTQARLIMNFLRNLMNEYIPTSSGGKSKKSKSAAKWTSNGGTFTDKSGITRTVYQNSKKAGNYVKKFIIKDGVKTTKYFRV